MKILIGDIVLAGGEEVNQSPYDISILNERDIQIAGSLRGTSAKGFDRGNQKTTVTFTVARRHDSIEAAQRFILEHAASLNGLENNLRIIEEPSGDTIYLPHAVIRNVQSSLSVNVTTHIYQIIGGNFSTSIN
ncbi:MAG: hypothetical protein K2L13_01630 [Opitutales bacterium]|nr:hypothetical protein [Opitutales bacterium]